MNKYIKRILALMVFLLLLVNVDIQGASGVGPGWSGSFSDAFMKVADPDTSFASGRFNDTSIENGRVWADKTVFTGSAPVHSILDTPIKTYNVNDDEFMVAISALSQSFNIQTVVAPIDVVFVIDVSSSMAAQPSGASTPSTCNNDSCASKGYLMIQSLNMAMNTLMGANPNNRASVVTFSHEIQEILPLAHWPNGGDNNFEYFNISGRYIGSPGNVNGTFTVNSSLINSVNNPATSTPFEACPDNPQVSQVISGTPNSCISQSGRFNEGTATQRGIYRGAQILIHASDKVFDTGQPDNDGTGNINVLRKPNIILMSDGKPTIGCNAVNLTGTGCDGTNLSIDGGNYGSSWQPTSDNLNNLGNGQESPAYLDGLDILSVATAAYWKQQVTNAYNAAASGDVGSVTTAFYTIGLLVEASNISQAAQADSRAVLGPAEWANLNVQDSQHAGYNQTNNPSMATYLNSLFSATGAVSIPLVTRTSNTVAMTPINLSGSLGPSAPNRPTTWQYDDAFYFANNAEDLENAFLSIAQTVLARADYVTNTDPAVENFSGNLIMSDVLGPYMEFRGAQALWMNGAFSSIADPTNPNQLKNLTKELTGASWAQGVVNQTITDIPFLSTHLGVDDTTIRNLLTGHRLAGQNKTHGIYYNSASDFNNSFMYWGNYENNRINFLKSYFDVNGNPTTAPSNATVLSRVFQWSGNVYDSISGDPVDLSDVIFYSIRSLVDDNPIPELYADVSSGYNVRYLMKDQYLVRWYVPGNLIPLRTVSLVSGRLEFIQTPPIRAFYRVGLRDNIASISPNKDGAHLTPNITITDVMNNVNQSRIHTNYPNSVMANAGNNNIARTPNSIWFYSNDWWDQDPGNCNSADGCTEDITRSQKNMSTYIFIPNQVNQFYFFANDTHSEIYCKDSNLDVCNPNVNTYDISQSYIKLYVLNSTPTPHMQRITALETTLENLGVAVTANEDGSLLQDGLGNTYVPATCPAGTVDTSKTFYQLVNNVVVVASDGTHTQGSVLLEVDSSLLSNSNCLSSAYDSSSNPVSNVVGLPAGTPRSPALFEQTTKDSNPTNSVEYIKLRDSITTGSDNSAGTTQQPAPEQVPLIVNHYLGNNGRLAIPITEVTVNKVWESGIVPTPICVQLFANDIAWGNPIQLNANINPAWSYTWQNLPVLDFNQANEVVSFIEYTIKEGTTSGANCTGTFTPYGPTNQPVDGNGQPFDIEVRQPQWDQASGTWATDARITNRPPKSPTITKDVDLTTAQPGDILTYTIVVHNPNDIVVLNDLLVTDDISANISAGYITYVVDSIRLNNQSLTDADDNDAGSYSNGLISVNIATLAAGADARITFQVRVGIGAVGHQIPNLASVTPPGGVPPINTPPVVTVVPPPEEPTLFKDVDKHTASVGDIITYKLRLVNPNPYEIYNFDVWDDLDSQYLAFVPGTIQVDGNSVTDAQDDDDGYYLDGSIYVNIVSVGARDHVDITFQARILPGSEGQTIENVGVLQSPPDPHIPPTTPPGSNRPTPPGDIPGAPPPKPSNKVKVVVVPPIPDTGVEATSLRLSAIFAGIGLVGTSMTLYKRKKID